MDSVTGRANPRNLCIDDDAQIPGYQKLMEALRPYQCAFFVELYHPGRQGMSMFNGNRKMPAPSAIECQCVHEPVYEMSLEDIAYEIQKYVDGAVRCQKAGVDGVMIHGAHGYLVNQFLSPPHQSPHRRLRRQSGKPGPLRPGYHPGHSGGLRPRLSHRHPDQRL